MEEQKQRKLSNILIIVIFLLFLTVFPIATILTKDREFSEMENRNLAQLPKYSFANLKSGKFTADIESYFSDQLFLKDQLVSLKVDCDRSIAKTFQNGVFFSDDNYLVQQYITDENQIDENIEYVNSWAEKIDCPIDFLLVPNAVSVLNDKLPSSAFNGDQQNDTSHIKDILSDKITLYDAYEPLKELSDNSTQVFYKTDHHWTSEGAKSVFSWYTQKSGQTENDAEYTVDTVNNFYGTLYSKAPSGFIKPEQIHFYNNKNGKYEVTYLSENKTTDTLYDKSFLVKKDKYSTFMGGNFSQVNIKTNAKSDEKVLIIKDSYANAIMPFFADQYSDITMIDMRYYHFEENTVSELVKLYDIDRVILVYNMDFVNSDQNFIWLE